MEKKIVKKGFKFLTGVFFVVILMICLSGAILFYQSKDIQVFGGEFLDCEIVERTENKCIITVAAKSDWVNNISDFYLNFKEGNADFDYVIEEQKESFWGYQLYHIIVHTYNYKFSENGCVSVDHIEVISKGNSYIIEPKKLKILCQNKDNLNKEDLYFSASPLEIPMDMQEFPIQLSVGSKNTVLIKDVKLTNSDIKKYNIEGNQKDFGKLVSGTFEEDYCIRFENSFLDRYVQYNTDIIITYEVDGKEYEVIPEVYSIYNPVNVDFFRKYWWEEIVLGNS